MAARMKEMEVSLPGGSRCSRPGGGSSRGIMPGRAELEGAELEGAALEGTELEGAETEGVEGAEPGCAAPGGLHPWLALAGARGVGFCCRLAIEWKNGRPRLSLWGGGGGGSGAPLVGASRIRE